MYLLYQYEYPADPRTPIRGPSRQYIPYYNLQDQGHVLSLLEDDPLVMIPLSRVSDKLQCSLTSGSSVQRPRTSDVLYLRD